MSGNLKTFRIALVMFFILIGGALYQRRQSKEMLRTRPVNLSSERQSRRRADKVVL